jgi:anti-sigma-K factor RskA
MNDQELMDNLTQEAAAGGPAFSADLHARIMARIDAEPSNAPSRPATASRNFWRFSAMFATAAAVVIAVGIARFAHKSPQIPQPHPEIAVVQMRAAPTITNPVQTLDDPAVRDWAGTECAGVNRDANNVVAYVQRQFDMLPPVP